MFDDVCVICFCHLQVCTAVRPQGLVSKRTNSIVSERIL